MGKQCSIKLTHVHKEANLVVDSLASYSHNLPISLHLFIDPLSFSKPLF